MENDCDMREWKKGLGYICHIDNAPCGTAETCRYYKLKNAWDARLKGDANG